eukprot:153645-Pleurochrysis_carterae.AAC.2
MISVQLARLKACIRVRPSCDGGALSLAGRYGQLGVNEVLRVSKPRLLDIPYVVTDASAGARLARTP